MIQLVSVTQSSVLNYGFKAIYEEAFPLDERRDWTQMIELLNHEAFCFMGIYLHEEIIGFISFWNLTEFTFIEHFAIKKIERGKGFGSQIFHQVLNHVRMPVVLEVEEPLSSDAKKRIEFYERMKFSVFEGSYYQPPYSIEKKSVKMLLMSYPNRISKADFVTIKSSIYASVYHVS